MSRAIVLAAGKGTRMKSTQPKVLHDLCGRPMLWYVLDALRTTGIEEIVVVANDELEPLLAPFGVRSVVQTPQRGTGHAVQVALAALEPRNETVVVAYGDMPLVDATIFEDVQAAVDADAGTALGLVTARMPLPSSFGRVVRNGATIEKIVEFRDATTAERAIDEMNAGIYAFDERALRAVIGRLDDKNAQGELYLTDTVGLLVAASYRVVPVQAVDYRLVLGVNDRAELAHGARDDERAAVRRAHAQRRHDRRSGDDLSRTRTRDRRRYDHLAEHLDRRQFDPRRAHAHRPERAALQRAARRRRLRHRERRARHGGRRRARRSVRSRICAHGNVRRRATCRSATSSS